MLRKMLLTAAVIAPLAWAPAEAAAQTRGTDRAATATAQAQAVAGWTHGQAQGRPTELPPEIAALFEGQALPPGLANTRTTTEPPPPDLDDSTGGTEGGTDEECVPTVVIINGQLLIENCDGTYTDPLAGTE